MLIFYNTHCCAIQEIGSLSTFRDPQEAMASFCRQNFAAPVKYNYVVAARDSLYSFYLFTAGYNHYTGDYGGKFRKFIEDNKLGTVWESPSRTNDAFHPGSANRVWIWMPDTTAVRAWWEAYRKSREPKEPPVAKEVGA